MKKFVLCILIALSVLSVNVSYAENAEYVDSILSTVSNMYSENATEWEILDMAAYGAMDMLSADDVDEYSREAHQLAETSSKATDLAKAALILTSIGENAESIVNRLANFESIGGINGAAFSLLAYDSNDYDVDGAKWTRKSLVEYLITAQKADGGWALTEDGASDADVTAMVVSALSSYDEAEVLEKAVLCLSEMQDDDGCYSSWGTKNSNSSAVVVTALCAMGIDADTDEKFIKNGISALDGLMSYKTDNDLFGYTDNQNADLFSTEQGFRAIVAYSKYKSSEHAFNVYKFITEKYKSVNVRIEGISENKLYVKNASVPYTGIKLSVSDAVKYCVSEENYTYFTSVYGGYFSGFFGDNEGFFGENYDGWQYRVNGKIPPVGADSCFLCEKDSVVFYYGSMDIMYPNEPIVEYNGSDTKIVFTYQKIVYDENFNASISTEPIVGAEVKIDNDNYVTDNEGKIVLKNISNGSHSLMIEKYGENVKDEKRLPLIVRFEPDYTVNIQNTYKKAEGKKTGNGSSVIVKPKKEELQNEETNEESVTVNSIKTETQNEDNAEEFAERKFKDIKGHWAEEYIYKLYDRKIVSGRSETIFAPDEFATRAEFISLICKMMPNDDIVDKAFYYDVSPDDWFYNAVCLGTALKLINGTDNGLFEPNNFITREQAALILSRLIDSETDGEVDFKDKSDISEWALSGVVVMKRFGYICGDTDNNFRPKNYLTRAEASKLICMLDDAKGTTE